MRPLVVKRAGGDQRDVDWTSLSRKHAIERDDERSVVTVFGGKLTDCLNVGEEVAEAVEALGVPLEDDLHNWYGEPAAATRGRVLPPGEADEARRAAHRRPASSRSRDRLWRRYGRRAFSMLEAIRDDPRMGEDIMESADYLRVELHLAASTEMITKLEDFMRRRSKIDLVVPDEEILDVERPARGGRDPVRCRCRPPAGRVPPHPASAPHEWSAGDRPRRSGPRTSQVSSRPARSPAARHASSSSMNVIEPSP